MKEYTRAQDDLSEALDIAELGSIKLHLYDYHLAAGRLCLDEGNETEAKEHSRLSREIIETTGYLRRKDEFRSLGSCEKVAALRTCFSMCPSAQFLSYLLILLPSSRDSTLKSQ